MKKKFLAVGLLSALLLISSQKAHAATITLPRGYTMNRVYKYNAGTIKHRDLVALKKASAKGMKENNYVDKSKYDNEHIISVKHISKKDNQRLVRFTLGVINNARKQFKQPKWKYDKRAQSLANDIAKEYTKHGKSCWDDDHYNAGINRAAKRHGLVHGYGNMYEDESGLPISNFWHTDLRSLAALKEQLYFNLKQMYFGGYWGANEKMSDLSRYVEWNHAGDLLGARPYSKNVPKLYGLSFSTLKNDPTRISVHFINIRHDLIMNKRKFNVD